MSFLYPNILWGLLAVGIPVIIHLFNFRRHRKVYFTNVKHLQELKVQTQRQSRLRHLLVLIARILAVTALVLAFSQPYIPVSDTISSGQAGGAISIFIDNSFSMEAEATEGELLAGAKSRAEEIAGAYRSSDRFQLLTNDFEGRHQRMVSREEFLELLEEVGLSPKVQPLSSVLERQREALLQDRAGRKDRFMISDFQKGICDFDQMKDDSVLSTYLVPVVPESTDNLFIDSCWFESPVHQLGQGVKLIVRIRNVSVSDYEKLPLKLTVNGMQKALASFDVPAEGTAIVELPFTNYEPGIQYGILEISDYPVTFDDKLYLVYNVQPAIPVLTIYGEAEPVFLNSLLGRDSAFSYKAVYYKNINYDELPAHFLIILDGLPAISSGLGQALTDFCQGGGSLLVIPSPEPDLDSYRGFLASLGVSTYGDQVEVETQVSYLDMEHSVFLDVFEGDRLGGKRPDATVDLPRVISYFPLELTGNAYSVSLMKLLNRADFLVAEQAGSGQAYLLSVPLNDDFSNFQRHALFVPVIFRIAFLSGATSPLFYTIGTDKAISIENNDVQPDGVMKIQDKGGSFELIPGQRSAGSAISLLVYDQIDKAAHYQVTSGEMVMGGLAFNFDRRESNLQVHSAEEIKDRIKSEGLKRFFLLNDNAGPVQETLQELYQGRRLWKLFIILALFFLAIEVFLLRVWSK